MKTDAIEACINRCLPLAGQDRGVYRDLVARSVAAARAELTALREEIARLRKAVDAAYLELEGPNTDPQVAREHLVDALSLFSERKDGGDDGE